MTICEKCRYCVLEKEEIMAPPTLPKPKTFLGIPVQIYDPMAVMIYFSARCPTGKFRDKFFCYAGPELKEGGKYKTRRGECVLLSAAPKRYGQPWAGLVFHEDSVEAALYLENGRIYSTKPHPLDIMSEWDEE